MILALNDRVGLVDLVVLIPAMKIEKESCCQFKPFGVLACTKASLTVTVLPETANLAERSAMPSVLEAPAAMVTLGSGISKSSGKSISIMEPASMGYSAPMLNLS